jgi:hypothetical protein
MIKEILPMWLNFCLFVGLVILYIVGGTFISSDEQNKEEAKRLEKIWTLAFSSIFATWTIISMFVTDSSYELKYREVSGGFVTGGRYVAFKEVSVRQDNDAVRRLTATKLVPFGEYLRFNDPDGILPVEAEGESLIVVRDKCKHRILTTGRSKTQSVLIQDNVLIGTHLKDGKYWEWDPEVETIKEGRLVEYVYR